MRYETKSENDSLSADFVRNSTFTHLLIHPARSRDDFHKIFSPPTSHTANEKNSRDEEKNAFLGVVHFNFSSPARSDAERFVFPSSYPSDASRPLMDVGVKKHFHGIGTESERRLR